MSDMNVSATIDIGKNITALLEKLAAQIGVTVDKVWPWLIKQQVIEGWMFVLILAAVVSVALPSFLAGAVLMRKSSEEVLPFALTLVSGLLLMACLFVGVGGLSSAVTKINNPEYAALRDLIAMVK